MAEQLYMPPPVIGQPVAAEPEPDAEPNLPSLLYYFEEVEETRRWREQRHGINRFRSR